MPLKVWIAVHEVVQGEVASATSRFQDLHDALVEETIFLFLHLLSSIRLCSQNIGFGSVPQKRSFKEFKTDRLGRREVIDGQRPR